MTKKERKETNTVRLFLKNQRQAAGPQTAKTENRKTKHHKRTPKKTSLHASATVKRKKGLATFSSLISLTPV